MIETKNLDDGAMWGGQVGLGWGYEAWEPHAFVLETCVTHWQLHLNENGLWWTTALPEH